MIEWVDLVNLCSVSAGLVMALLGLLISLFARDRERWNRRFFLCLFTLLFAYVASSLICSISLDFFGSEAVWFSQVSLYCESLFSSLLMPLLSLYLLYCAGESWKKSPLMGAVAALWLAYFALLTATQFLPGIYTITPNNVYQRGPWYPVLLVPPVLLMLLNLIALWRRRSALSQRRQLAFSLYLLIPLLCMIIQMFAYGLLMIAIGSCVAAFCMLFFILLDQGDRYRAQQEENARQHASIAVLQMRPHFIYNTMMSIYYLCRQDPEKAQQVTLDFTSYLRKNFTAIAKEGTVPFTDELEHARAYLAVEQTRFEGRLFTEIDTPHTNFQLPPLTLQPIVENAVKHGVSPELEPLYISVLTRETPDGSEIIVEDTGPGFTPADDNEPHIALANIRERLDMLCGGTLTIEPRAAGGTSVTLFIPNRTDTPKRRGKKAGRAKPTKS